MQLGACATASVSAASRSSEYAAGSDRRVTRAVAPVIEHHDPVVAGEGVDVVREVLLRAAETVHEEQAGSIDRTDHERLEARPRRPS